MADTLTNPVHPPLGGAQIVSATFAVLVRHFGLFMAIALVPSMILSALQLLLLPGALRPPLDQAAADPDMPARMLISGALTLLIGLLVMGMVTLAAYDTRLRRPVRLGPYAARSLAAAPAVIVLGALLYVGIGVGVVLLVVPGLYLAARYWVLVPAILVERAGFSGLSRAAALSRHYRWPIAGALLLMLLLVMLIGLALTVLFAAILGTGLMPLPSDSNLILLTLIQVIGNALQYALISIFTALLYARLRELKEGLGMEDLVSVFE